MKRYRSRMAPRKWMAYILRAGADPLISMIMCWQTHVARNEFKTNVKTNLKFADPIFNRWRISVKAIFSFHSSI